MLTAPLNDMATFAFERERACEARLEPRRPALPIVYRGRFLACSRHTRPSHSRAIWMASNAPGSVGPPRVSARVAGDPPGGGACEDRPESEVEFAGGVSCRVPHEPAPKRRLTKRQREALCELGVPAAPARSRAEILAAARQAKKDKALAAQRVVEEPGQTTESATIVRSVAVSLPTVPASTVEDLLHERERFAGLRMPLFADIVGPLVSDPAFLATPVDEAVDRTMRLLCHGQGHMYFARELGEKIGISKEAQVDSIVQDLPASLAVVDSSLRYSTDRCIQHVVNASGGALVPIMYIEYFRYDETPMKVVLKHLSYTSGQRSIGAASGGDGLQLVSAKSLGKEQSPAKLFQSEGQFAWLLQYPPPPPPGGERIVLHCHR